MNERLQELLCAARRPAAQVGGSAADAAYGVGRRAGELLSVAKLNIQVMDRKGEVDAALRQVGEMIYATHTGTPTESEVLLAKLQEIDALRENITSWSRRSPGSRAERYAPSAGPRPSGATYFAGNAEGNCDGVHV